MSSYPPKKNLTCSVVWTKGKESPRRNKNVSLKSPSARPKNFKVICFSESFHWFTHVRGISQILHQEKIRQSWRVTCDIFDTKFRNNWLNQILGIIFDIIHEIFVNIQLPFTHFATKSTTGTNYRKKGSNLPRKVVAAYSWFHSHQIKPPCSLARRVYFNLSGPRCCPVFKAWSTCLINGFFFPISSQSQMSIIHSQKCALTDLAKRDISHRVIASFLDVSGTHLHHFTTRD